MLQDVANQMSRTELLRRLSTHSSSTSCSSKRGSTRITKPPSASNSPNYVQRRRTTANHASRTGVRSSQEYSYQTREQRLRNYYNSKQPMPYPRPMSWHPGSDAFYSPSSQVPTSEPSLGHTIANLENLAVSGTPTSSVQQSIQNAFAMGYGYPISAPIPMYGASLGETQSCRMVDPISEPVCDSYPTYSVSDQTQNPYIPQPPMYDAYTNPSYQPSQQWSQNASYFSMDSQASKAMQEYRPTQPSTSTVRKAKAASAPQLARRKSKELVGMGLYDDRASGFMSGLNSAVSEDSSRDSMGRGLKLEETWQPPDDDDAEEDDEGYSTEEVEEEEEAPPPVMASAPAEAQTTLYPTYADMSDQSFFFNDDDEYVGDDHYARYIAYSQTLPENQPKPQMNPGMENYLWL